MLVVMGVVEIEEGTIDQVRDAIATMENETRKEPGCLDYSFSVEVSNPATMRISERWESMEALEAHMNTPHMAAFGAALGKARPKSLNVNVYEVARERELPR